MILLAAFAGASIRRRPRRDLDRVRVATVTTNAREAQRRWGTAVPYSRRLFTFWQQDGSARRAELVKVAAMGRRAECAQWRRPLKPKIGEHVIPLGTRTLRALIASTCAVSVVLLMALSADASAAETTGYGELTRFGLPASGGRQGEAKANELSEARTISIGVDPAEENSVFVLEERKEPELKEEAKQSTRFFRLKKFTASVSKGKTTYSEAASQTFEEASPHLLSTDLHAKQPVVNGLAVDAKSGRLFLLTSDLRAEADTIDRTEGEGGEEAVNAASTLYAFKTAELAPAGETHLEPQSDTPGVALLDPQGITVDPVSEEVIVLAHVDQAGTPNDSLEAASDHFVVQRHQAGSRPDRDIRRRNQRVQKEDRRKIHPEPHLADPGSREQRRGRAPDGRLGLRSGRSAVSVHQRKLDHQSV